MNWKMENPLGKAVTLAVFSPNTTPSASDDMVIVNVSDDNGTYRHTKYNKAGTLTSHMTLKQVY